jgi:hypothetical protein
VVTLKTDIEHARPDTKPTGPASRIAAAAAAAICIPLLAAILACAAFLLLGVAATFADKAAIRTHVAAAFATGELTDQLAPAMERGAPCGHSTTA